MPSRSEIESGNYDVKEYPVEIFCKCGKKEVCEKGSLIHRSGLCMICFKKEYDKEHV